MAKSKFYEFMLNLDMLSYNPQLGFGGESQYRSFIGLMLSLVAYGIIIGFGIYFFIRLVEGDEIFIVSSKLTHFDSAIRFKDITFAFKIMNGYEQVVPNDIVVVRPYLMEADYVQNVHTRHMLDLRPCTIDDFKDHDKIEGFDLEDPSIFSCFDWEKSDVEDPQILEDPSKWLYLNLPVMRCMNITKEENPYFAHEGCRPQEEIDKYFQENDFYYVYYYTKNGIDHNVRSDPITYKYAFNEEALSKDFYLQYYHTFSKIYYESDNGFFFEDIKKYETVTFNTGSLMLEKQGPNSFPPGSISFYQLRSYSAEADLHKRTYTKLQDYLANMGGILGLVLTIGEYISLFITEGLCSKDIMMALLKRNDHERKVFINNTIRIIPENQVGQFGDVLQTGNVIKESEVLRINQPNRNRRDQQDFANQNAQAINSKIDSVNMEYSNQNRPYANRKNFGNYANRFEDDGYYNSRNLRKGHKGSNGSSEEKSSSSSKRNSSASEEKSSYQSYDIEYNNYRRHNERKAGKEKDAEEKLGNYSIKSTIKISWYHSLFAAFFGCCCTNKRIRLLKEYQDYVAKKLSVDYIIPQMIKYNMAYDFLSNDEKFIQTEVLKDANVNNNQNRFENDIFSLRQIQRSGSKSSRNPKLSRMQSISLDPRYAPQYEQEMNPNYVQESNPDDVQNNQNIGQNKQQPNRRINQNNQQEMKPVYNQNTKRNYKQN